VSKTLDYPIGHKNSYSIQDLIQIIKEMAHISKSSSVTEQYNTLVHSPLTQTILLHFLTKEYLTDGEFREVTIEEMFELLKHVSTTLCNLFLDHTVCLEINEKFDMLSIMKNLFQKYFLSDSCVPI